MADFIVVQSWRGVLNGANASFSPGQVIDPATLGETFYSLRAAGVPLAPYDAGMAMALDAFRERTQPGGDVLGVLHAFGLIAGGTGLSFVSSPAGFPEADAEGVITLVDGAAYFLTGHVDLLGARIVAGKNSVILGTSSENCSLTSTGLTGVPLITSQYSLPMRNLAIRNVQQGFAITQGSDPDPIAIDWTGVNFSGCEVTGVIGTVSNFIFSDSAVLGSGPIRFTGTVGTVGVNNSLFVSDGAGSELFDVQATAVIARRFRVIYSAFVVSAPDTGIVFDAGATVPTEAYILDTVNFSGAGTYLAGVDDASNKTLFVRCTGIRNTSVSGQMYMRDNAAATVISDTVTFVKAAGVTTPSMENAKYDHANNRLTCRAVVERKYLVQAHLSFETGNNNVVELGIYSSSEGGMCAGSLIKSTASGVGRAEGVSVACVIRQGDGDYLELHLRNTSLANNVTVVDLNFVVIEIAS